MTTPEVSIPAQRSRPRVWLVARVAKTAEPTDHPTVRDDLMRRWRRGSDGRWHAGDGRHHVTWSQLHACHDLVEVTHR